MKNILAENMRRFGTKNLMPLHESTLSDDDILDIIMTYTDNPEAGEAALANYRKTGDFGDAEITANVTRDPRWTGSDKEAGIKDGDDEILFRDFTIGDTIEINPSAFPNFEFPYGTEGEIFDIDKADYASDDLVYTVRIKYIDSLGDISNELHIENSSQYLNEADKKKPHKQQKT